MLFRSRQSFAVGGAIVLAFVVVIYVSAVVTAEYYQRPSPSSDVVIFYLRTGVVSSLIHSAYDLLVQQLFPSMVNLSTNADTGTLL